MFSIGKVQSASDAHSYFIDKDNYYLSDKAEIEAGTGWFGKGAEKLELVGKTVDEATFLELLEGRVKGEQVGLMRDGSIKHRPATDLTFSAPKSVSIMALVHGDKRLLQAHTKAVEVTLKKIETMYAEARTTKAGVTRFEKTGNLVMALFTHTSSRELDPQLHTHGVTMNLTERQDGHWRALASRNKHAKDQVGHGFRENVLENQHYIGMSYSSELAKNVTDLGYRIQVKDSYGNFDIEGLPDDYLQSQSKRREQITNLLTKNGHQGGKAAEMAALASRRQKAVIDPAELRELWQQDAQNQQVDLQAIYDDSLQPTLKPNISSQLPTVSGDAMTAIRDAIDHLGQYRVAFTHGDVVRQGFIFGAGHLTHEALEKTIEQLHNEGELVGQLHESYTTKALLEAENTVKASVTRLKHSTSSHLVQRSGVVADILSSTDGAHTVPLNGLKKEITLINELVHTSEAKGLAVTVLHPNRSSVNRLQGDVVRERGNFWQVIKNHFKGELLQTVHGFVSDASTNATGFHRSKPGVIAVLDAQKLGYQTVNELLKIADNTQSKVVFFQNQQGSESVKAGSAMRVLADAGVKRHRSLPTTASRATLITSKTMNKTAVQLMVESDELRHNIPH
jgi:conjugative relaxase-like TrwC/TraI family protein